MFEGGWNASRAETQVYKNENKRPNSAENPFKQTGWNAVRWAVSRPQVFSYFSECREWNRLKWVKSSWDCCRSWGVLSRLRERGRAEILFAKNCKKSSHREEDGSTETASQGFTSEWNTLKQGCPILVLKSYCPACFRGFPLPTHLIQMISSSSSSAAAC